MSPLSLPNRNMGAGVSSGIAVPSLGCQELDCSGLLGVSKTMVLWINESVVQGTMVQRRAQSSNWIDDERDPEIVKK